MSDDKIYTAILRLHDKVDDQGKDITKIRVTIAEYPWRLKILERVVYGLIALILIAVVADVVKPKETIAESKSKTAYRRQING